MTFEDKLKGEAKKAAENYDLKIMKGTAGQELYVVMNEFFGGDDLAQAWFYSPKDAFNGKSPYQLCLNHERETVRGLISQLALKAAV